MTRRLHWNREGGATRPSLYGKVACRRPRWCELISMYICASVASDCRSAGNCIPLYRIIHVGLGDYLYSSSVLLPPHSLSRNSCTFPKTLVTDSSRFSRQTTTVFHRTAQSVSGLEPIFILSQSSCLPVLCLATLVLSRRCLSQAVTRQGLAE